MSRDAVPVEWSSESSEPLSSSAVSSAESVSDLVWLRPLSDDTLMHALRYRFKKKEIYTNVHSILIALNPYQPLPLLYTASQLAAYSIHTPAADRASLPPHVFAIARDAYERATGAGGHAPASQSILISGESGAGKTETTKYLLAYIAAVSEQSHSPDPAVGVDGSGVVSDVESSLLLANPILESFGNAKTSRNDNSSRFGRWISVELRDDARGIARARIIPYLLEESRVVARGVNERGFNVFYQMLAHDVAANPAALTAASFNYLRGTTYTVPGTDDAQLFAGVQASLTALGMNDTNQREMFDLLRGVLWLGQIEFGDGGTKGGKESAQILPTSETALDTTATYLGLSVSALRLALCVKVIVSGRQSVIRVDRNVAQAMEVRDSIAKCLFGRIFLHLVRFLNAGMSRGEESERTAVTAAAQQPKEGDEMKKPPVTIGILDIFGFEVFEVNSLSQLMINWANERLHQHFLSYVFKMDRELLAAEGVQMPASFDDGGNFADNALCLELLEKRPIGLFSTLNDELSVPKGTDAGFIQKLHSHHAGDVKHPHYAKPRVSAASGRRTDPRLDFVIVHFAASVTYSAEGFLDQNRSKLSDGVLELFQDSGVDMVRSIFAKEAPTTNTEETNGKATSPFGRRGTIAPVASGPTSPTPARRASMATGPGSSASKPTSLVSQFHVSLTSLLTSINATSSHFIRCVKTNTAKTPDLFEDDLVYQQLRNSGMIDVVRQRQAQMRREKETGGGYTERIAHRAFVERFRCITHHASIRSSRNSRGGASPRVTPGVAAVPASVPISTHSEAESLASVGIVLDLLCDVTPWIRRSATVAAVSAEGDDGVLPPYQVGKTRVFCTAACWSTFEATRRGLVHLAAVRIQALVRGVVCRRRWRERIRAFSALQSAIRSRDLPALEAALTLGRSTGLATRHLDAGERVRDAVREVAAAASLIDLALQSPAASWVDRLRMCQSAIDAATKARILDPSPNAASPTASTNKRPSHISALLQKQAEFLVKYSAALRECEADLQRLVQKAAVDQASLGPLGQHIATLDARVAPLMTESEARTLSLASPAVAQLRDLSSSAEAIKASQRHAELESLANSFARARKARDVDAMLAIAESAADATRGVSVEWSELRIARIFDQALQLEQETHAVLETRIASQMKQLVSRLKYLQLDTTLCRDLDTCFSEPTSISVASLLIAVESALSQVQVEAAAVESLKHAIQTADPESIQAAVVIAENAIKQRGGESTSRGAQLDDLLATASSDFARLTRIRECSRDLKLLGVHLADDAVAHIASVLAAAIDAGVPKEETEPVARRLLELETRLEMQRAMEARDVATLEVAIQVAEARLAKNEMEVLTTRFQDTLTRARHTLSLLRSLVALSESAAALQDRQQPPVDDDALHRAESAFKSAYSSSLLLGARDSELAEYDELMRPLRAAEAPPSNEGDLLQTQSDIAAQKVQYHYQEVRRTINEEDKERMRQLKVSRATMAHAAEGVQEETTHSKTNSSSSSSVSDSRSTNEATSQPTTPTAEGAPPAVISPFRLKRRATTSHATAKSKSTANTIGDGDDSTPVRTRATTTTTSSTPKSIPISCVTAPKRRPVERRRPSGSFGSPHPLYYSAPPVASSSLAALPRRPVVRYPTLDDPIAEAAQRDHQRRASLLQMQAAKARLERERLDQEEEDRQREEGDSREHDASTQQIPPMAELEPVPERPPSTQPGAPESLPPVIATSAGDLGATVVTSRWSVNLTDMESARSARDLKEIPTDAPPTNPTDIDAARPPAACCTIM